MCAGLVPLDRVIVGRDVAPGDVIVGVRSSGLHSNGFTLARRALFDQGKLEPDQRVTRLGSTLGDELLRPTHIYVRPVVELLANPDVAIRALVNITGDGFLNLARIEASVGFRLDTLPEPQPIFELIQTAGSVPAREMYRVFNMGIGFCLILPDDAAMLRAVADAFGRHGFETSPIGRVVADERKRVVLPEQNLVGQGDRFEDR
jgi:phosphoribosylformylglycinamidine cyclo-ligase